MHSPKRQQNSEYFKDKMLLMQAQEKGVVLDEEQLFIAGRQTNMFDDDVDKAPVQDLALNEDQVFQANQCDAFDSDVDEAPTTQTMFMANLSLADPIYNEAGPSYDSDILYNILTLFSFNLLNSDSTILNSGLIPWIGRRSELVEGMLEQQDLSLFGETQLDVVMELF
ncbi:hypothetical protein Tco_0938486 [Tanacetum coccineum]|uniref:Retrovirus-related Pol polyprotein from transposon TNT 1-94 n=1 Tax=Tanacetum coccineum TaxID=301880 RepID=A0ABQ5DHC6_9ASTR